MGSRRGPAGRRSAPSLSRVLCPALGRGVAQERGFEFVGTTLAVSPYQLFETCNDVLERLAAARGLTPVIRDFRPYYPEATRRSRELGMYRQNYCGCRFSAVEAAMDRARIRDERKAAKK